MLTRNANSEANIGKASKTMKMKVVSDEVFIEQALSRLTIIDKKIRSDLATEGDFHIYRELGNKVSALVQPMLRKLSEAGLLSVLVDMKSGVLKKKYSLTELEVCVDRVPNGQAGITLRAEGKPVGTMLALTKEGHPNIGSGCSFEKYSRELHRLALKPKGKFEDWLKKNEIDLIRRYNEYNKLNKQ